MTTNDFQKYPIGQFVEPTTINNKLRSEYIHIIASFHEKINNEVISLTNQQLDTPYREDGWTINQLVHHLADTNINCFARIKFALTEENPAIKPFFEDKWAELLDAKKFPISASLKIIEGIHERWAALLNNMSETEWNKTFYHPELEKNVQIGQAMAKYSWHCLHHLAHITTLKKQKKW